MNTQELSLLLSIYRISLRPYLCCIEVPFVALEGLSAKFLVLDYYVHKVVYEEEDRCYLISISAIALA